MKKTHCIFLRFLLRFPSGSRFLRNSVRYATSDFWMWNRKNGLFHRRRWNCRRYLLCFKFRLLPSSHGVLIHFNCEDIEQTLEKVLFERWESSHSQNKDRGRRKGWFAVFTDSEGNRIASMLKITGREEGTACLEVTAVPSSPYPDYSTGI